MRPAGWKLFGHAMFELSQLNVTEVAEFVQRNFQNLFTKGAPPGKQIQNGDVRVGVLPQREEFLIGSTGFGGVALHSIGSAELEMRQCADRFVENDSAMVENFLELNSGLVALMPGQIGFAAHIDGMQSGHEGTAAGGTLCPQVIGSGGLKSLNGLNGLGRIVVAERELGVNRWQVVELDHRILWEALGQISR